MLSGLVPATSLKMLGLCGGTGGAQACQESPFQWSMNVCSRGVRYPTAHASEFESAYTAKRTLDCEVKGWEVSTCQADPSQCSMRLVELPFPNPTAQPSSGPLNETP